MRDIVWVMDRSEIMYNFQVVKCFSPDSIDLSIIDPNDDCFTGSIAAFSGLSHLQELGYHVSRMDDVKKIRQYRNIIMNSSGLGRQGKFRDEKLPHSRCVMMCHSVDAVIGAGDKPPHWYLFASQRQAEGKERNKVSRSDNVRLFNYLMSLPAALRDEFAYSGPYHIGHWAAKRHDSKALLQQELAETYRYSFDPNKPVVAFLEDEFCHEQQVIDGLKRLAPHVNLVVKGRELLSIPGVFVYPNYAYAPNLLRFAADYILAGYHSGTLASSTMLGLPVVPYYTTMVFYRGRLYGKRARYTCYLDRPLGKSDMRLDILESLNSPLDLQNTEALLERFSDGAWWAEYTRRLPAVQQAIFGNYAIDGAAEKTAQLIKRVFEQESFGEATTAVRLRPEAGRVVKSARTICL